MLMVMGAGLMLVPAVTAHARAVTVGDLVRRIDGARLDAAAAAHVVMRLPAGRRRVTIAAPAAAALVRRAIGILPIVDGDTVVVTAQSPGGERPIRSTGRRTIGDGAIVTRGTALTLRTTAGPVAIERAVTTLQPGRSGRRVFVRDAAGQVFAVPLVVAERAR